MRKMKRILATCMLLVLLLIPATMVQAEDWQDSNPDDYVTKEFNVSVTFDKAHVATVTEVIKVDFRKQHHGITRNIPNAKDKTYEVKNISVDKYKSEIESNDNNTIIRIGDGDVYLSGDQTFTIHYQIEYFKDDNSKADFLAQNMLPTEWDTSIRKAKLTLTMPEEIDWSGVYIYAGKYGSDDAAAWQEKFTAVADETTLEMKGKKLPKGYGVTLRDTALPEGYWSDTRSFMDAHKGSVTTIYIVAVVTALVAAFLWFAFGRDDKIVETVEFYPPENMTPPEVGYALDEELEDSEMMTLIFYLADKGYLSIEKKKKNFMFHKEKEPDVNEPEFVKTFMKGLFKKKDVVNTANVPTSFHDPFLKSKDKVIEVYKEKFGEVFEANSYISRFACILLTAINVAVLCITMDGLDGLYLAFLPALLIIYGYLRAWKGFDLVSTKNGKGLIKIVTGALLYVVGTGFLAWAYDSYPSKTHLYAYMVSLIVIFGFSLIMQKRSKKSVELAGKLYGFRTFIKEAEYDKLVELCDEDPEYFYHILPYAAVLGLETTWTKHFEKIKIPQPCWYRSEEAAFLYSTMWCQDMMKSCTKTAVPSSPSGGSSGGFSGGFSGGGFSGGGGGGGGGGAW